MQTRFTRRTRLLSWLLTLAMLLSIAPVSAFAEGDDTPAEGSDTSVEINAANFPDKKFRKIVSAFDTDGDDSLSQDEIAAVTEIDCSNKGIHDLTGIEYFTALTTLDVSRNRLTALDVSGNTELDFLDASNNKLAALDVSGNTALTSLDVSDNRLTKLDIEQNTKLAELDVSGNKLTYLSTYQHGTLTSLDASDNELEWLSALNEKLAALDVSGNTTLTELSLGGNQLTELDVSGNTALTYLTIYRNQLTELDVSGNTALEWLKCYDNNLTKLDVSGNTALEWLECYDNNLTELDVSGSTALKHLYCYDNNLTKLDVSENSALEVLDCFKNKLTELDVSGNTAMWRLIGFSNQLTSLDLSPNSAPTQFDLDNNSYPIQLTAENTFDLSTLPGNFDVSRASNWQGGTVSGNTLTVNPGVTTVTYTYQCNENLSAGFTLDVSGNAPVPTGIAIDEANFPDENFRNYVQETFDEDGNKFLSQEEINKVTQMSCSSRKISDLTGIEYFTGLEQLYCFENQLTSLDLSKNTALTTLSCYDNALTKLDVSQNPALTYLSVTGNALTELDVSQNKVLETLYCLENNLTKLNVSGADALKLLDCRNNQLTTLDVSKNKKLWHLYCPENNLTELNLNGADALEELKCSGNQLKTLDLSQNPDVYHLECANNALTELDVSQNEYLMELFCSNNALTALDVRQNTALTTLGCSGNQLTSLDLSQNPDLEADDYSNDDNLYSIQLKADNTFDLSKLPGKFDVSRASNWQGGSVSGNILTVDKDTTTVTYTYQCSDAISTNFTLDISGYAPDPDPDKPDPDNPDKPNPDTPDKPDPDNPDKPNPDTPDKPDPDNPDKPNPDTPDKPDPDNPDNPDQPGPDTPAQQHTLTFEDCTVEVTSASSGASTTYTASPIRVAKGDRVTLKLDETRIPEGMKFNGFVIDPIPAPDEMTTDGTTVTFTMPDENTTVRVNFCTESEDSSLDFGTVVAGTAVAGAVGFVAYQVGTEVILDQLLPEGVAVPRTRAELALLLWKNAGSPAPAAAPAFVDVEDPALASAAQWALEQGYLNAREDGSFAPEKRVAKWRVIKAWKAASRSNAAQ